MTTPPATGPNAATATSAPATPDALLAEARRLGVDRWEAQRLLEHLLGQPRAWLITHGDATLPAAQATTYRSHLARRLAGEPLAYLVGEQEFHGLTLHVSPEVLVPRPDTETLVDWALAELPALGSAPRVLDLGTGSGAIALALRHRAPQAEVWAADVSPTALAVAQRNGERLSLPVRWCLGDWWHAVALGERFHLVVSNPPYIAEGDPHLPGLKHEPLGALTPGGDGLDAYRHILAGVPTHLLPGGWVLFEHGWDQAPAVTALLSQAGCTEVSTRHDLAGQPRCTGGRWLG